MLMQEELEAISGADDSRENLPLVIIYKKPGTVTENGIFAESGTAEKKVAFLEEYLLENQYTCIYENSGYQVFDR